MSLRGSGIWLRLAEIPPVEDAIASLDYVVVPLHSGERGILRPGPTLRQWLETYQARGGEVWGMDWLPLADEGRGAFPHLSATCTLARDLSCVGLMGDLEPDAGWRGRAQAAAEYRAAIAKHARDLDLAITDYATGGIGARALEALLAEVDGVRPVGVPQSYDPAGRYAPGYHEKSVSYWEGLGADRVAVGVGAWLRGEKRHRGREEFRQHVGDVPERALGVCAWYASRAGLAPLLPVLGGRRRTQPPEAAPSPREAAVGELEAIAARLKPSDPDAAEIVAAAALALTVPRAWISR